MTALHLIMQEEKFESINTEATKNYYHSLSAVF